MDKNLLKATEDYWTRRADGYSKVNQEELTGVQHTNWKQFLVKEIEKTYPGHQPSDIHILDIGCGPGFFSAILAECGYVVTAIDYTQVMLKEAKDNAATCGVQDKIRFLQMDAQALAFADTSFDVVVSRILTWNLQEPAVAYKEWCRVLKKGGLLLNFDANWYGYLYDDKKPMRKTVRIHRNWAWRITMWGRTLMPWNGSLIRCHFPRCSVRHGMRLF